MVLHMVMWKLREFDTPGERREAEETIRAGLEGLVGKVPGLLEARVSKVIAPKGYDLGLLARFDSTEALAAYQEHPAHLAVRRFVHSAVTDRFASDWICG